MNVLRSITPLALLCLLCAQPAAAQLSGQDEAAIRAIHDAARTSLISGDAAGYVRHFSEDVVLQTPNAPTVRGRAALEAWARGFATEGSLTWPNLQLHGAGDLAYATTDYLRRLGDVQDQGKQLAVYRRDRDGKWWIVAASFSSDLPGPADVNGSNEAAAAVFYSVWNSREYGRLDAVLDPAFRRSGSDAGTEGLAEWKAYMGQIHATYSDFRIEVHEQRYDGDVGMTHWTVTGTDRATGSGIIVPGMSLLRFRNGIITEQMAYFDPALLEGR